MNGARDVAMPMEIRSSQTNPILTSSPSGNRRITAFIASAALAMGGLVEAPCTEDPPRITDVVVVDGGSSFHERPRVGDGTVASDWSLVEGRMFYRPHAALRLGLGVGASRDGYRSNDLERDPGLPNEVHHAWARVPLAVMFHENWGLTFQGSLGTGTDGEASAQQGRQWQIQGGPVYVRDKDLIICLLVNVSSRIDERPTIFPFPSIFWHFHDDWRLTVVDDVDNLSHLRYAASDNLDLGVRLDVRFREAALGGDRVLSDDHVAAAVQATWMPAGRGHWEITPFVGAQLMRRLAIRDAGGDERWSLITRPAPLLGLNLRAEF